MGSINYIDLFERAARCTPHATALVDSSGSVTFADLRSKARQIGNAIVARGFGRETPYALLSPNSNAALIAHIGAQMAGCAWININMRSGAETNIEILSRAQCRILFYHSSCAAEARQYASATPCIEAAVCVDGKDGSESIAALTADASAAPLNVRLGSNEVGFLGTTGGTTGRPKITRTSQAFISMSALGFMTALKFDRPPVNLAVAPITHAGGMVAKSILAMGGTVVMASSADPAEILSSIEKHKVSFLFLPPTVIYVLLQAADLKSYDLSSLKYLLSAAAPIQPDRIRAVVRDIGPVFCQSLGQTECGMPLTFISPEEIVEAIAEPRLERRLESVGRPVAVLNRVEVLNDDGDILDAGDVGEIAISAPSVMMEYLGDAEETAKIKHGEFQRTGDLGFIDEDGFVYITDRKRDLIISGGFNVYPYEVERVLLSHSGVLDCTVIGVPHEKWGEAVAAIVQTVPGADVHAEELIALCKQRLGSINAPKYVEFIGELPKSAVGKILKRELRQTYRNLAK